LGALSCCFFRLQFVEVSESLFGAEVWRLVLRSFTGKPMANTTKKQKTIEMTARRAKPSWR
jgi:hypothetical protein